LIGQADVNYSTDKVPEVKVLCWIRNLDYLLVLPGERILIFDEVVDARILVTIDLTHMWRLHFVVEVRVIHTTMSLALSNVGNGSWTRLSVDLVVDNWIR